MYYEKNCWILRSTYLQFDFCFVDFLYILEIVILKEQINGIVKF